MTNLYLQTTTATVQLSCHWFIPGFKTCKETFNWSIPTGYLQDTSTIPQWYLKERYMIPPKSFFGGVKFHQKEFCQSWGDLPLLLVATELDLLQSDAMAFAQLAQVDHLEVAGGNQLSKTVEMLTMWTWPVG